MRARSAPRSAADFTAPLPVPGVVSPQLDAASRAITSIHDHRHSVADSSNAAPTFNSLGQAHKPGKGSGVRITSEVAGPLAFTASGALPPDPFDRASPSKHRTRTELLAARRSAMRAPDSYDLGGDGVVDQREYFYATKFDTNGDGALDQGERETAAGLMKSAATKLVFIPPRGAKFHRNTFSRYSHAVVPGHSVLQVKGAIVSEQLEGHAALARSRLPGGGGAAGALGAAGAHLPPETAEAVGEVLLGGTQGAARGRGVEVDLDTSDNVVNLHTAGAVPDFDRVQVKLGFRPELHASGSKLRSELLAARKAARAPALSYDVDGDGNVSARDFFFSARQDRGGALALDAEARARAAVEERGGGLGQFFTEIRGDGAGQVGHRVQQREGAVLGEDSAGGWAALTHSRMYGTNVRIGLDGNLKYAGEEASAEGGGEGGAAARLLGDRDSGGLTVNGRVALETVAGAVTDYDTVTVKPHYRPALAASGARSARELALRRALDRRPHASFDLSANGGAGAVSAEDYHLAKRFDSGDKGYLTPSEAAAAQEALAGGLREQFTRLSTGSSRALATRTFQRADGSVECEGADVVADEARGEAPYDASVRLGTKGCVPGLDLPGEIAAGTYQPGSATTSGALTHNAASLRAIDREKPFVSTSCGVVPGVARAVVRFPDGRLESYGGYAGGLGAGGPSNVTAPKAVEVSPGSHRAALGEHTLLGPLAGSSSSSSSSSSAGGGAAEGAQPAAQRLDDTLASAASRLGGGGGGGVSLDATAHSTTPWHAPRPAQSSQLTLRPPPGVNPEAPFRTHNQTTFCDPEDRDSVHAQAPYALAGVGGTGDGVAAWSEDMEAQRRTAPALGLRTASQLKAARRRNRDSEWHASVHALPAALALSATLGAGRPSDPALAPAIAAAALLPANALALSQTAAWLGGGSTVAGAAALAAAGGALPPGAAATLSPALTAPALTLTGTHAYAPASPAAQLPPHGATLRDATEASARTPSGAPVVLDRTGRGAYTGGLDGLSTAVARAAMPPLLYTHVAAAAGAAGAVLLGAPGSPLRAASAPPPTALLPAYLARSLASAGSLGVDSSELASELVKPGALDESVRSSEAPTRSALTALRRRSAVLAARRDYEAGEDEGGGAGPPPALPDLATTHYNDSTARSAGHGESLLGEGGGVSKTRSALRQRLRARAIAEALPDAPTGPATIHPAPLPSFAARLSASGTPWYADGAARAVALGPPEGAASLVPARGVAGGAPSYTAVSSALDGPAPPEDAALAALPGNYSGVAREYDAALRHTVRAPQAAGRRAEGEAELGASRGARVALAPPGVGARSPRLIVDGLAREEEGAQAAAGAFDKVREVRSCDLGRAVRRREGAVADKVTAVDPQALSESALLSASNASVAPGSPAGGGGSGFVSSPGGGGGSGASGGGLPRLYELHPNVSSLGSGLPGAPPWHGDAALRASLVANPFGSAGGSGGAAGGGRWAVAQLEHAARCAGSDLTALDSEGKAPVSPRDVRPLYSSFTSDGALALPYVTPHGLALQPSSPSRTQLSAAAAAVGGSVRPGAPVTAYRAQPSQGVPGPEAPRPLRAALAHDVEARRGSVYGVEAGAGGGGGAAVDVSVRGAATGRWGEGGASARALREGDAVGGGGGAAPAASPRAPPRGGAAPEPLPSARLYSEVRTGGFRD